MSKKAETPKAAGKMIAPPDGNRSGDEIRRVGIG